MTWALLPLKDLVQAKTRLAGVLTPSERRALAQAMVEDVLTVLITVDELEGVLLVSDDPAAQMLARHYGVDLVEERQLGCRGLNEAVAAGVACLLERGVKDVMVLHTDLPLLAGTDIQAALEAYAQTDTDLLIAPDGAGEGTNLMIFPAGDPPQFQYGEGSCPAHQADAIARGQRVGLIHRANLQCDVDSAADVLEAWQGLRDAQQVTHSSRVLCEGEIARRLASMISDEAGAVSVESQNDAV